LSLSHPFRFLFFILLSFVPAVSAFVFDTSSGVAVQGPDHQPNLGFACCEQGIEQLQSLAANQSVLDALKTLHAQVAIPIQDFSSERADAIRRLDEQGIPVIAWLTLARQDGYYMNAGNEPQAEKRVADFEQWTREHGLQWAAVGLDIEPDFVALGDLRKHRLRLLATLLGRAFNTSRTGRAIQLYIALIHRLQSQGYVVQTYQMPYVPAERDVNSSLLDRVLGTIDLRGNQDYLMLYSNYARPFSSGIVWSLGRSAQAIAVGSTEGPGTPGTGSGPLNWDEFSRDLIVASHYTNRVGVYDLEGCVRQGFLPRLETFNWSQSVVLPAASVQRAERMGRFMRVILWLASQILYFVVAFILLAAWFIGRWRNRHLAATAVRLPVP
jgi:hypothetical protein